MRSRLLLVRRAGHLKLQRSFTQSTVARIDFGGRPRLPFLAVPTTHAGLVRYLTTDRTARLKYEIKTGIKYTGYVWIAGISLLAAYFAIAQESLERSYPTPHEWSFRTRMNFRGGNCARYEPPEGKVTDWLQVAWWFEQTINRLHDAAIDGKDVKDAGHEYPPGTKDVTAKSEEWRRGYFMTLMGYAKAVEHMDGWVLDKSRNICFPPGTMIGPSNPYPKPLPPGFKGAPREEDCVPRFESPDDIYMRILSTPGFTNRQRIEAGLAYASWLEYKGIAGPAGIVFEDAVRLAAAERPGLPAAPLDGRTYVLNDAAGPPSENLLTTLTAYATFRARQGDVSSALPILVSLLKARRALPAAPPVSLAASLASDKPKNEGPFAKLAGFLAPPPYPRPRRTAPPRRPATTPSTRASRPPCPCTSARSCSPRRAATARTASPGRATPSTWPRSCSTASRRRPAPRSTTRRASRARSALRRGWGTGRPWWRSSRERRRRGGRSSSGPARRGAGG
ncbi:hypothetical protein VTJ83DRAFT_3931 [Remersonia thermophila]|uniref:Uncharacterized protein n=1 Tax=Remersonia thermophila TaxID=72144 RepID=A0ABR4DG02_9PEZI